MCWLRLGRKFEDELMEKLKERYMSLWPNFDLQSSQDWKAVDGTRLLKRELPEDIDALAQDSRWPALFPSPMCIVTTNDGSVGVMEKVVSPVIVNRFPYVMSLSFCSRGLSSRHYPRTKFLEALEKGESVAVQFIAPGDSLNRIMDAIASVDDVDIDKRIESTGLTTRKAISNNAPVFSAAYLVYEGKFVKESKDVEGQTIYQKPYSDIGSHRIYFFEINVIQLQQDVAEGRCQIAWQSLPDWKPQFEVPPPEKMITAQDDNRYQKGYNSNYRFPSKNTIAFEADYVKDRMSVMELSTELKTGNDDSRWPCFFPSSLGMITAFMEDGTPNLMPCGSTAVVGRFPFIIGICVGYAAINERYRHRASLEIIRKAGKFGCGVPFVSDKIIKAVTYSGNRSIADDKRKLLNSGLSVDESFDVPVLPDLPVTFACKVIDEIRLGTHVMFFGEVFNIYAREDVTESNPLRWYPWAKITTE